MDGACMKRTTMMFLPSPSPPIVISSLVCEDFVVAVFERLEYKAPRCACRLSEKQGRGGVWFRAFPRQGLSRKILLPLVKLFSNLIQFWTSYPGGRVYYRSVIILGFPQPQSRGKALSLLRSQGGVQHSTWSTRKPIYPGMHVVRSRRCLPNKSKQIEQIMQIIK